MAPTDDDQKEERESRVQELMKGYRREQPAPPESAIDQRSIAIDEAFSGKRRNRKRRSAE